MRTLVAACVISGLFLAIQGQPTPQETAAMQGTWKIESFINNGDTLSNDTFSSWRRIVKDDRVTWKRGDEVLVELSIKYNPRVKPMTLDSTIQSGDGKGQTLLAIYELNDGELRVCAAPPGKPRPRDFSSTPGSDQLFYSARRIGQ